MQAVRVDGLTKRYETTAAVAGVSLEIRAGELFTLLGPSGCGKTTLLRTLAGLEEPDSGSIQFGAERVEHRPSHLRNIGMVFQSYALFPHMTVADNVAYGLRARRLPEKEVRERVEEALALVQMSEFAPRTPDKLSGGQQQRVALARALATRPALLLMDEPLSNLDARLRLTMREEIRRLQRQVGITTVYVTHDQEEALAISDRIAVMESGRVLQVGTPSEIYHKPARKAVAAFVGACSFLEAEVTAGGVVLLGGREFTREIAFVGKAVVGLRPEAVKPLPPGWAPPGEVVLQAHVEEEIFHGAFVSVRAVLKSGERVTALSTQPVGSFPPGARLALSFPPSAAMLFDAATEEAIR